MALNSGGAEQGATTSRILNKLNYAFSEIAEDIGTAATGDIVVVLDASDNYNVKYGDAANIKEIISLDGLTATDDEINAVADVSGRIIDLDATSLTVTAGTHGERIVTLSHTAATSTVTLPAATGTGNIYRFIVSAVNTNNHVIQVANATDVFEGVAWMANDTDSSVSAFETGASDDTLTLNGTTTGGAAIGDKVEIIDYASGKFMIHAFLTGTGTEATPFSAAVS